MTTPFYTDDWLTLYGGDCREVLAGLPADSVDCVVTSPPYWGLRDYGTATWSGGDAECDHRVGRFEYETPVSDKQRSNNGSAGHQARTDCPKCGATRIDSQLGLERTPEEYVANMVNVFREVRRVLKPSGTCWLNLGDSYNAYNGGAGPSSSISAGASTEQRPRLETGFGLRTKGLKPKDLVGIPWLVAKALQEPYYTGKLKREADRAWLAGWLDGEGTISFVERDRGANHTATHDVRVFITNTDREPLDYFAAISGGKVYQHEDGTRDNRYGSRPCYRWQMGTHDAALLIQELYPYLRTKRRQAALVWTLYGTLRHKNGHARTPEPVVARRREISEMVRALNRGEDVTLPVWVEEPPSATEPGWYLRSDIIWSKPNPMPESVTDRPTKSHEYLFLLTKSARYYFDADAVREDATTAGEIRGGGHKASTAGIHGGRTDGQRLAQLGAQPTPAGRNIRSVWTIATRPYPGAHFAVFPPELPERCIKAGSSEKGVCAQCGAPWERVVERTAMVVKPTPKREAWQASDDHARTQVGGTMIQPPSSTTTGWRPTCHDHTEDECGALLAPAVILDPFGGSGTVGMVANRLSRRAILIDLNPEYLKQQMRRNAQTPLGLTEGDAA
jgi:DNA modification methylase